MKTVIIIQARMRSSRLPDKIMKIINGKPMIELIVKRLKKSKQANEVVVATSNQPENKVLINHLKKIKAKILEINVEKERMSLGIKQLTDDPFEKIKKEYKKNTQVTGKITSITDSGIEVKVTEQIKGFIKKRRRKIKCQMKFHNR